MIEAAEVSTLILPTTDVESSVTPSRKAAIISLIQSGISQSKAAVAHNVSRQYVSQIWYRFRAGLDSPRKRGRPVGTYQAPVSREDEVELARVLEHSTPTASGLSIVRRTRDRWTEDLAKRWFALRFGHRISRRQIRFALLESSLYLDDEGVFHRSRRKPAETANGAASGVYAQPSPLLHPTRFGRSGRPLRQKDVIGILTREDIELMRESNRQMGEQIAALRASGAPSPDPLPVTGTRGAKTGRHRKQRSRSRRRSRRK